MKGCSCIWSSSYQPANIRSATMPGKTIKLGLHAPGQWCGKLCSTILDWNISGIASASDWIILSCVPKHTVRQAERCLCLAAAVHRIWPSNSHFSLSCLNMTIRAGRSWSVISRPLSHVVRISLRRILNLDMKWMWFPLLSRCFTSCLISVTLQQWQRYQHTHAHTHTHIKAIKSFYIQKNKIRPSVLKIITMVAGTHRYRSDKQQNFASLKHILIWWDAWL